MDSFTGSHVRSRLFVDVFTSSARNELAARCISIHHRKIKDSNGNVWPLGFLYRIGDCIFFAIEQHLGRFFVLHDLARRASNYTSNNVPDSAV